MVFQKAPDIQKKVTSLVKQLSLSYIDPRKIITFRSSGSKARARARIWSFPRIWQQALGLSPYYCIEVMKERFDHLTREEQTRILIHELLHIPRNFSGALLSHRGRSRRIDAREVEKLFQKIK
ncbi:MAG TPA: putative metallopeptidase [Candidatus Bathyarchaeia archaeon]|nr:putative metallopeptidase [Candidatus Bathyarchaeia archaeon]